MALHVVTTDAEANTLFDPATMPVPLKDGDVVHFQAKAGNAAYTARVGGYIVSKSVEIYGDGPGLPGNGSGTTISPATDNDHIFVISHPSGADLPDVYIHDLKLWRSSAPPVPPAGTLGGNGIHCVTTNRVVTGLHLARITILNLMGDGIHLEGANPGPAAIDVPILTHCNVGHCYGRALYLKYAASAVVLGGVYAGCSGKATDSTARSGVYLEGCSTPRLFGTSIANNLTTAENLDWNYNVQLRLKSSHASNVYGCHFENYAGNTGSPPSRTAVTVENCFGGEILGCFFGLPATATGSRGIYVANFSSGVFVGSNFWGNIETLVEIQSGNSNTGNVVLPQSVFTGSGGSTISVPDEDNNGNFIYVPTTKTSNIGAGLLLPRITTATRNALPAESLKRGLVVFNSSPGVNRLNVYSGVATTPDAWHTLVAKVGKEENLTNQAAAIATTTLLANVPAGMYRVIVVHTVTTTGTSQKLNTIIKWTDSNGAQSVNPAAEIALNAKGFRQGSAVIQVIDGSSITYETTISGSGGGAARYSLAIRLEAL